MHVAVGVVINADAKILIAERPVNKSKAGYWEFPGGKVEEGETTFQALRRELHEELGIFILSALPLICVDYSYPEGMVTLDTWVIKEFSGQPKGIEGQKLEWVSVDQLNNFIFPEGNKSIICALADQTFT